MIGRCYDRVCITDSRLILGGDFTSLLNHLENGALDLVHDFFAPPCSIGVESGAETVVTG